MTRRLLSYLDNPDTAELLAFGFGLPPAPVLRPPRALAMVSAVMAQLAMVAGHVRIVPVADSEVSPTPRTEVDGEGILHRPPVSGWCE